MPETDNPDLERRQWLFDRLADLTGGGGAYPPAAVVDSLTSLQLPEPYDLAWATATYADDTAETTWSGAVANSTVLVEFTATAKLANLQGWDGNSTRGAVEYDKAPVIELDVSRLADVASLNVTATGSYDAANACRLRQTWVFTFTDGNTRSYDIDTSDRTLPADVEKLCWRLAQHLSAQ